MSDPRVRNAPSRRGLAIEALLAVAAALGTGLWGLAVDVNPLDRVGQVSILAHMHLAYAALAALAIGLAILPLLTRLNAATPERVACALLAGASTGFVAGAMAAALNGTPLWIGGEVGDVRNMAYWSDDLLETGRLQPGYPPGILVITAATSKILGETAVYALPKVLFALTALTGPIGYLAWRTLARPTLALALGVVAALPLVDPYKPLGNAMVAPVIVGVVLLVRSVRNAPGWSGRAAMLRGALLGAAMGVVFLMYSGWFLWLTPGACLAVLVILPWRGARDAWRRVAVFLGATAAAFAPLALVYLVPLTRHGMEPDAFFYFDTWVDPAYFLMWRGGKPGDPGVWPPHGELGGAGVFSVLLAIVLGFAVAEVVREAAARKRGHGGRAGGTEILGVVVLSIPGVWLWRMYLASRMFETQRVDLWPRTSPLLMYLLLVAAMVLIQRAASVRAQRLEASQPAVLPGRYLGLAAVVAMACIIAVAVSARADEYMPSEVPESNGSITRLAHTSQLPDGTCPVHAPGGTCKPRQ